MENIATIAGQYGPMGLMLAASFWYINKRDTEYREERGQRDLVLQDMHDKALDVVTKNTTALVELSLIIKNK